MDSAFSKNLLLLRKERGLSQKTVSASLNISQALLSHYEKGIRECGLNFVIKSADYYGVSCDFILGRTNQRTNTKPEKMGKISNERIINSSTALVFSMLKKIDNMALTNEITNYLCTSVYTMLRIITNQKNNDSMFKLSKISFPAVANAGMTMSKARSREMIESEGLTNILPLISSETIGHDYPAIAPLVQEMVSIAEDSAMAE